MTLGGVLERVALAELRAHPRNYRAHPLDQLQQLAASLAEHGQYRLIVLARDGTILAGHGVVEAARLLGWTHLDARRLELAPDSARARKLLAADNLLARLAVDDEAGLVALLEEVQLEDLNGLDGTGIDGSMLAAFAAVLGPAGPRQDYSAHWAGLPEHRGPGEDWALDVTFGSLADRLAFQELIGASPHSGEHVIWWPAAKMDPMIALRFEA